MDKTPQIFSALAAIMKEVEPIGKNKKNTSQNFMYRGIDDMYNELQPTFVKHKVFITSEVLKCTREERVSKSGGLLIWTVLKVKFSFYAEDGSSISSITMGEGMDSGDKGMNKAMSIALKYCLMQLLLIPTEDLKKDDPDGQVHEVAAKNGKQQPAQQQQPATVDPVILQQWKTEVDRCATLDELTDYFNKSKENANAFPQIKALFTERRKQLSQPQTATA